jgi:hypothetical protein
VRAHSSPADRIFVMWSAANVYYLSDRAPAVRYMWYRNIQVIPGALGEVHAALAGSARPLLVVAEQSPAALDPGGQTAQLLAAHYHQVAGIDGVVIYQRS